MNVRILSLSANDFKGIVVPKTSKKMELDSNRVGVIKRVSLFSSPYLKGFFFRKTKKWIYSLST